MTEDGSAFNIGGPGPGTGGLDKAAHVGHLLSFVNPTSETRDGISGAYEVAVCSFVLCHVCMDGWEDLAVSGTALAPRLTTADSEVVAGVLTTGEAKAGRTAPYLLADASAEQLETVRAHYDHYAMKMPTGKVVVDLDAFTAAEAL